MKPKKELIAEFMAQKIDGDYYLLPSLGWIHRGVLKYDSSWDWLMPVVEKISLLIYETRKDNNGYKDVLIHDRAYPRTFGMINTDGKWMVRFNRLFLHECDTLMEATFNAIVEFVEFYNEKPEWKVTLH